MVVTLLAPHAHLSESHNFQANTSDNGGDCEWRENAGNSSLAKIRIF